jgi:hypothetical protein
MCRQVDLFPPFAKSRTLEANRIVSPTTLYMRECIAVLDERAAVNKAVSTRTSESCMLFARGFGGASEEEDRVRVKC